jgi:hypothetical protein
VQEGDPDVRYLYSQPITSPSDDRNLVTWDGAPDSEEYVFIKKDEESLCHLDVLEKKIALNSQAIGALMCGFVLGQQSFYTSISPEQEKRLKEKFAKLETYKDINEK